MSQTVTVFDPTPCDWLWRKEKRGLKLNIMPDQPPAIVVIATKPQRVGEALEQWRGEPFKAHIVRFHCRWCYAFFL